MGFGSNVWARGWICALSMPAWCQHGVSMVVCQHGASMVPAWCQHGGMGVEAQLLVQISPYCLFPGWSRVTLHHAHYSKKGEKFAPIKGLFSLGFSQKFGIACLLSGVHSCGLGKARSANSCESSRPNTEKYISICRNQGCVIRSFGTFNTVKCVLNTEYAYNTFVFLSNSADF